MNTLLTDIRPTTDKLFRKCLGVIRSIGRDQDFDTLDIESFAIGYLVGTGVDKDLAREIGVDAAYAYFRGNN